MQFLLEGIVCFCYFFSLYFLFIMNNKFSNWFRVFLCALALLGCGVCHGREGPVLLMMGTRPEGIKLLPCYEALKREKVPVLICSTGQHPQLLEDVFLLFGCAPDFDLKIMEKGQGLSEMSQKILARVKEVYQKTKPALVVVQGDTTTAFVSALAAFYMKIPVAHVEAGLRSHNRDRPFPEEMNRRLISSIASIHFAPTQSAVTNLLKEGIAKESIYCTGNTVMDALLHFKRKIAAKELQPSPSLAAVVKKAHGEKKRLLFLTAHRRESWNGGLERIFCGVKTALLEDPNLFVVFPLHPNPIIKVALEKSGLDKCLNILITSSLSYFDCVYLLNEADGVLTDSGGIQEEATSLQKPLLILRDESDREEGITAGTALLVGRDPKRILSGVKWMSQREQSRVSNKPSPYGNGDAAQQIARVIKERIHQ